MFDPPPHKNRRITGPDWETELQLAKWMHRPLRHFHDDKPFYPWLPPEPLVNQDHRVNFKLNFTE